MKLETIQKLLAVASKEPDTPQGKTARALAEKNLAKLGLNEADVAVREAIILTKARRIWESALADVVATVNHAVELRQRVDKKAETDNLLLRGAGADVGVAEYRFITLRRAVLRLSGLYHMELRKCLMDAQIPPLVEIFCNYAVIALSERMLIAELEDTELDQIEEDLGLIDEDEDPLPELPSEEEPAGDEAGGLFDKLLETTENEVELDFDLGKLDPTLCGYQAGLGVELTDAIPSESTQTVEQARRLTRSPILISFDPLKDVDDDKQSESPDRTNRW